MPNRTPADPWTASDPALALALEQLEWYASGRDSARRAYQTCEVLLLVTAAGTTLAAAFQVHPWVTASLAAASLVVAGVRRVFEWHENYLAWGAAWVELRTAINSYRLLPEDQRNEQARTELADKMHAVVTGAADQWAARRRSLAGGASS
jgi:hypothetical protein